MRDRWIKAEAAQLAPGSRVLDAGAGASKYRPFFQHCRYETQDFCKYEGHLVTYEQPIDHICEITKIPLPDGCLDAIVCTEVIEHVVDPMAVLDEFSRLLKPGGRLFLTAPHGTTLHMEPFHFYGGFTHYWYRHWLPHYGFEIDAILPQCGPGRCASIYLQAFYQSWRTWEQTLRGWRRLLSLGSRMCVKIPIHYVFAWILPKFDPYLDCYKICIGLMVGSTRKSKPQAPDIQKGS